MSYVRKNSNKVRASIGAMILAAALAMWQFYLFATFEHADGILDLEGGKSHLWWAISLTALACIAGFFVFSAFAQRDRSDELHITS
jgi:hypothetical protein